MPLRESDSDESIDQLEQFRNANVKPGMFVSGWEDPNDEIFEEKNPRGETIDDFLEWISKFLQKK